MKRKYTERKILIFLFYQNKNNKTTPNPKTIKATKQEYYANAALKAAVRCNSKTG